MTHRDRKLLDLAHEAPCFLAIGECSGQVVPCHSDMLIDGRGVGHKSHDCLAVPGCVACHSLFTRENLGRDGYLQKHRNALQMYLIWLWDNEKVRVA